jgi:hypothetical protein
MSHRSCDAVCRGAAVLQGAGGGLAACNPLAAQARTPHRVHASRSVNTHAPPHAQASHAHRQAHDTATACSSWGPRRTSSWWGGASTPSALAARPGLVSLGACGLVHACRMALLPLAWGVARTRVAPLPPLAPCRRQQRHTHTHTHTCTHTHTHLNQHTRGLVHASDRPDALLWHPERLLPRPGTQGGACVNSCSSRQPYCVACT